jgi:hypothetical protein
LIQQFVYSELSSSNGFLKARACWVYSQFAKFEMTDEHLKYAMDAMFQNLSDNDLPVRVNAAIALVRLLENHPFGADLVRPGLGQVIKIYLKLIDDIEYDELIECLKVIVTVFEQEIAPYAVDLCSKLSESFLRLMESSQYMNGKDLEVDSETSLTADGLMTAIRRILGSISGNKALTNAYPQLELILEKPIQKALEDPR